ncbi:class I SAM-dependent methyltransferase [Actinomycetospora sp.]|jgi:SAM-dependent methyltransferase|uniref:class I SAM-dependent methyltransferase n=1 Tax=Actinomycetospora sp. TaxID=1872135 RepID=UPI002F423860
MTLPDFDAAYRGSSIAEGVTTVPWNIGEPQPAIAALVDAGRVASPVLDAGCGIGATTIALTQRGYEAVGIDLSDSAVARARDDAAAAGLGPEFAVADVSTFTGYDGRFATVIDSTLFHSMPVEARPGYAASTARASRPGATLIVLAFDVSAPFPEEVRPNCVTAAELAAAVAPHWTVDSVEPSTIRAFTPPDWGELPEDDAGRRVFPAHLLLAHRG